MTILFICQNNFSRTLFFESIVCILLIHKQVMETLLERGPIDMIKRSRKQDTAFTGDRLLK